MKTRILLLLVIIVIAMLIAKSVYSQNFYLDLNKIRRQHFLKELSVDSSLVIESKNQILTIQNKWNGVLMHGCTKPTKGHKFKAEVLAKNSDLELWLKHKDHRKLILNRKARRIGMSRIDDIACARLTD